VLSIQCNKICLQFSLYRAPLQSLGLLPSVFSWKKKDYIKNYDTILLSKYDSTEKSYSYVNSLERRKYVAVFFLNPVKNPVFIRAIFIPYDLTVNSFGKAFVHVRNCVDEESTWHKSNRGRTNTLMETLDSLLDSRKKQRRISFVLDYLRMILWKISPAISIKHRILATFNIKKKFNSDSIALINQSLIGIEGKL
jgi:hypothetical protein